MFLLDSLLVGGLRFVLDKIAAAADQELNDETALRDRLLTAQLQLEMGEITEAEFSAIEASVLARLREVRAQHGGGATGPGEFRVTGVEASVRGGKS